MKHKVGDKVKVRKDLIAEEEYGECTFVSSMNKFLGTEQVIRMVGQGNDGYEYFKIEGDPDCWSFTDEMLEGQP